LSFPLPCLCFLYSLNSLLPYSSYTS
jgi:hypothetical protein